MLRCRLLRFAPAPATAAAIPGLAALRCEIATDPALLQSYNTDWLRQKSGNAAAVAFPRCTADVSELLRYCTAHRIAVVPQGGNTGLVHGSIPVKDEQVILSMQKMNATLDINRSSMTMTCDAGVILETAQKAARARGLHVPIDLGARGSCHIGGNIATNAGGMHYARYGSLHANVLGLEVVKADGEVLNLMQTTTRKDNTGYALKNLFIGSEGTLGVITKASMQLFPAPKDTQVAVFVFTSEVAVARAFRKAKEVLGEALSAFEVMDGTSLMATSTTALDQSRATSGRKGPSTSSSSSPDPATSSQQTEQKKQEDSSALPVSVPKDGFLVLVETHSARCQTAAVEELYTALCECEDGDSNDSNIETTTTTTKTTTNPSPLSSSSTSPIDAVIGESETQRQQLWQIREELPVKLAQLGTMFKYDFCCSVGAASASSPPSPSSSSTSSAHPSTASSSSTSPTTIAGDHDRSIADDNNSYSAAPDDDPLYFYDPVPYASALLDAAAAAGRLPDRAAVLVVGYGHYGDGNVHLNVVDRSRAQAAEVTAALEPALYHWCARRGGSISAEHGVGAMKRQLLTETKDAAALRLMGDLKRVMDPLGILNPFKVV